MKVLFITAGAADMYCGSCFRDNTLAAELMSRGHEVVLVPLYTPTRTDEPNVSQNQVFFGGISVYLEQHLPLFRKTPRFLDRLWDSPRVLKSLARFSVRTDPRRLGELTVSMLKGEEGHQRKEFRKLLDWLRREAPPDVVNLPNTLLIGLARPLKKTLERPICCTLQGEDLFLEGLSEPYRGQALNLIRSQLDSVDVFIAVSDYYAEFMTGYLGIPRAKIQVVPLGIRLEGYEPRPPRGAGPFTIGYFARITADKGLHVLCETYRLLRQQKGLPRARLEAAGYLGAEHRDYLRGIELEMKAWGLADEFQYRGVLDRRRKIEFLRSLDVLSVPSTYAEPKGMYVLEAMACGVPVVQPRCGAFPEIIRKTKGGILAEANDLEGLAEGILSLWKNPSLAEELGRKGAEGVREHYSVSRMASRTLEVYNSLLRPTAVRQ